ncbi:MAG: hypothetical protein ACI93R_000433 [Flavobacteriales bacterium]|jgi:hypothetical protein
MSAHSAPRTAKQLHAAYCEWVDNDESISVETLQRTIESFSRRLNTQSTSTHPDDDESFFRAIIDEANERVLSMTEDGRNETTPIVKPPASTGREESNSSEDLKLDMTPLIRHGDYDSVAQLSPESKAQALKELLKHEGLDKGAQSMRYRTQTND